MPDLTNFPWALNQDIPEGYGYPAEALRAQHYAATSGGTGVDTPTALKVQAQPAPDGTILVLPGGATAASNYDGQVNQSYHAFFGVPQVIDIPPTGSSSSGRHDLVILRFIDPDHEQIPGYDGEYPIPADVATGMQFFWIEVMPYRDRRTTFPFPFVPLAHIRRGPNRTTVEPDDIIDLRELANPQIKPHSRGQNLSMADEQSLHTGSVVWPEVATHMVDVPEWATRMQIHAQVSMVRSHHTAGEDGVARGNFQFSIVAPDGTRATTQQAEWATDGEQNSERFSIALSHNLGVRPQMRGEECRIELLARKYFGPNVYADGATSWWVYVSFEQDVA